MMSTTRRNSEQPQAVMTVEAILKYQDLVRQMPISEQVAEYAVKLMRATRPTDESSPDFVKNWVQFGCGPRAGQSLIMAAKANAALSGRTDVAFEDIRKYALPTLRHRIALNFTAASEGVNTDQVIKQILDYVKTD
ncbi:MAG: MoxR family ATPase, partial [Verrucomicrobiota bacterium]